MSDILRNGFYVGLGLALKTRKMIEDFGRRFVEENKMNEDEGRKFVNRLLRQSEETRDDLFNVVEERIRRILAEVGIPKKDEIEDLEKRMRQMEVKISELSESKKAK